MYLAFGGSSSLSRSRSRVLGPCLTAWVTATGLLGLVDAAVKFENDNYSLTLGKPFEIKWSTDKSPVDLKLCKLGSNGVIGVNQVIKLDAGGSSYTWTPPNELPSGEYYLCIEDDSRNLVLSDRFAVEDTGKANASSSSSIQSPTSSTQASNPASAAPTATSPSADAPPTGDPGGLSIGARVGIGVGVGLSSTVFLFTLLLFYKRRRLSKPEPDSEEAPEFEPRHARTPTPKPPSRGILGSRPRAFSPFSPASSNAPSRTGFRTPTESPTPYSDHGDKATKGDKAAKLIIIPPLAELAAGDMDFPDRAELPTPANTPELPGDTKESMPSWL